MIKLISYADADKAINMSSLYIRLKELYTTEELIVKYEEEKPKLVRKMRDFETKVENINKYNFSFDFYYNIALQPNKHTEQDKKQIISILIIFERTRYFLHCYCHQML